MRVLGRALCALFCLAPVASSWAAPLGPSAPSQFLQVRTFGTACATVSTGSVRLDLRTLKDGSTTFAYEIPAKQVAVIRSVRFDAAAAAATSVTVFLEMAGNYVAYTEGFTDAAGRFQGVFAFDPGVEVSNLANFCVRTQTGGSIGAIATGFLTKDK